MTIKTQMTSAPDLQQIAMIHDACFPRSWSADAIRDMLEVPGTIACTTEDGSGFALVRLIAGDLEVLTLSILPEHRRRGAGRRIITTFCEWAANNGALTAFLEVAEHNDAARLLYDQLGFSVVGQRREYYRNEDGSQEHALIMRKALSP